jgi:hypothetical protein
MLSKRVFCLLALFFMLSLAAVNAYATNTRIGLLDASYNDPSSPSGRSSIVMSDIPEVGWYTPGLVRTRVFWPCYEQQQGVFTFEDCYQDTNIRDMVQSGLKLSIVVRTRTEVGRGFPADFWGTHKEGEVHDPGISYPPNDLSDVWSDDYGYSPNYYLFLKTFLKHYSDIGIFFHSIVIENEANSDFWFIGTPDDPEASMDQYAHMVATAKKAVLDLGLSTKTKVYDSGLTSDSIEILALNDYVRDNRLYDAWLLYQKIHGTTDISPASISNYVASALTNYPVRAAIHLIEDPNSLIYKGSMADGLNFHFYNYPETIPEILGYLRKMLPSGFTLVTNEVGIFDLPGDLATRQDMASRIMMESFPIMLNYTSGPVVWFSGPARLDVDVSCDGAIVDNTFNLVLPLAMQYKRLLDVYDGKILSSTDRSGSETMRINTQFSDRKVSVEWVRPEIPSVTNKASTRNGCTVSDSTGTVIPAGSQYTMDPGHPFLTVCYPVSPSPTPQPPVLEFVPDHSKPALEPFSIIVEATDPNGTAPTLSATPLPQGATFFNKAPGINVLAWTPTKDQVGQYNITFKASDGVFSSSQVMKLTITPPIDIDGDGMADTWERQTFFHLNRTGTLDADHDGISDLDEYQNGLNPLVSDAPASPVILAPVEGSEVATFRPTLTVTNGTDPNSRLLKVVFQVANYGDVKMTNILASQVVSAGTQGKTSWQVPAGVLTENTRYRWRAFMENLYTDSPPVVGTFFVNTVNNAPTYFNIVGPTNGTVLATKTPTLTVNKATDPDGDTITYGFEVYAADKVTLVASTSGLPQADTISWQVSPQLADNAQYFWKGVATDSHGLATVTGLYSFAANVSNDPPVAIDFPVLTNEDQAISVTLGATDIEGDPLTYSIVSPPPHGALTGVPPKLLYTPAQDYNGTDSFTYKANDGTHDSNTATVTITISAVNDPPTITPIAPKTINEDQSTGPVAFVIGDVDNALNQLTVTATSSNTTLLPSGSIVLGGSGANRTIAAKPAPNKSGQVNIKLTVSDGTLSKTTTFSLYVKPVNDAPVANNATINISEDRTWTGHVFATDAEADPLTYTLVTTGTKGTAVLTDPTTGACTYTPRPNANGQDSFTFRANDGKLNSQIAIITVNITAVNDAPVANPQSVTTAEDTPIAITLTGSDVEGKPLTYSVVGGPSHGTLSGTAPNLTYTPFVNFKGTDVFRFKVDDGQASSTAAAVNLTVLSVNDNPTISAIAIQSMKEDTQKIVYFSVGDVETAASDLQLQVTSDNLTLISSTGMVTGGTGAARNVTLTPKPNRSGKAGITIAVTDGDNGAASATFQLTVLAVNDAPVANDASYTTQENVPVSGQLTGSDVEKSPLTFSLVANGTLGKAVITNPSTGAFTYTPKANATGQDYFTFRAYDGQLYSKAATITVNITAAPN